MSSASLRNYRKTKHKRKNIHYDPGYVYHLQSRKKRNNYVEDQELNECYMDIILERTEEDHICYNSTDNTVRSYCIIFIEGNYNW
jgi:hypothetical protein